MPEPQYTIRYRHRVATSTDALVVEEDGGRTYLLTREGFACHWSSAAPRRPIARVLRGAGWVPVPRVAPYTLPDLCRLVHFTTAAPCEAGAAAAK
jgi:hypothetical protein